MLAHIEALEGQADGLMRDGKPAEALAAMERAVATLAAGLKDRTDLPAAERRLAELYGKLASIQVQLADLDGASRSLLDSWVTYRGLAGRLQDVPDLQADISITLQKIARVQMLLGRPEVALKFIQDASVIMMKLMRENPAKTEFAQYLGAYRNLLEECAVALGKAR